MPTYGYQCTECKHEFQVFQAMKDEPVSTCPQCSAPVKRLLYPVGVVFKGSGWYVTDSRKPEPSAESAGRPDTAEKKETTEKAAESKPVPSAGSADSTSAPSAEKTT